ncbi:MAG: hypothetical protein M0T77_01975 [Actinomycetota bacterium]|nr:hypothetical protein [Actinomycetota bacterium]
MNGPGAEEPPDAEHAAWREQLAATGMPVTAVIDEQPAQPGERLCLPAQHEHRRPVKALQTPGRW